MSEQQTTATAVQATTASACPHPEAVGKRWGDPISAERQAELQGDLDRWAAETDHGERKGPFDWGQGEVGVVLTGADVFWLAEQSGRDDSGWVPNLRLEGAHLFGAHLEWAYLAGAHLGSADLYQAHLEGADLIEVRLEGAQLYGAHLEVAKLYWARLEVAHLGARLERPSIGEARLEAADL
jgi:hypothetical protein